jgi:glycosyltransferase involved in cell wall biosynthesis
LPVIVSDLGGPKELVEDGTTGIVTKAHDAEDFARAIERVSGDAKLRMRMGQEARQRVIDRSWPGAFQKFWQATEL